MAAVLVCGEQAVLSHRTAAALWGLRPSTGGKIEVTVPLGGPRRSGDGIRRRESGIVAERFAAVSDGIPVTTPAWTLLDLSAVLRPHQLRRAVEQADRLELFDLRAVEVVLRVDPGRAGSPALRALLEDMRAHDVTRTRSDPEAAGPSTAPAARSPTTAPGIAGRFRPDGASRGSRHTRSAPRRRRSPRSSWRSWPAVIRREVLVASTLLRATR